MRILVARGSSPGGGACRPAPLALVLEPEQDLEPEPARLAVLLALVLELELRLSPPDDGAGVPASIGFGLGSVPGVEPDGDLPSSDAEVDGPRARILVARGSSPEDGAGTPALLELDLELVPDMGLMCERCVSRVRRRGSLGEKERREEENAVEEEAWVEMMGSGGFWVGGR